MKFTLFIVILLFIAGCKDKKKPDVTPIDVTIGRLDRDVFALDTLHPDIQSLRDKYGRFFDVYTGGVLQLGVSADPDFEEVFLYFLKDPIMREVADTVAVKYPEMEKQEKALSWAWAYYSYYFPGHLVPKVFSHISGFNQSIVVDSAAVGIGIDNYLGRDCIFYSMLAVPVPMYARQKMTERDIARDVVSGWLSSEYVFRPLKNDLISGMIYQGKMAYVLNKLFPDEPQKYVFGFSDDQMKWSENNEAQIWSFLIDNDYLFSTQQRLIMKYLNEAPYTSGMPTESPGKVVVWTGFRIVEKYMSKTDVSPEELMNEQDYHKILRIAGYRP